jgi:hypothetical protein
LKEIPLNFFPRRFDMDRESIFAGKNGPRLPHAGLPGGTTDMRTKRLSPWMLLATLGMGLLSGCQTWVPEAGLTLPSGEYLKHLPQFIPPSPQFPLPREEASLEAAQALQGPNPPRVGVGVGGP